MIIHRDEVSFRKIFSSELVIDKVKIDDRHLYVVREDLLPGGSKQRACAPFLNRLSALGYQSFIYASPFCGFAQVALSYVCSKLNLSCHIFCEVDPFSGALHDFSRLAQSYGATIHAVRSLIEAEEKAQFASLRLKGSYKIPLGLNCLEYRTALKKELSIQWKSLKARLKESRLNLWLPVGSGTLASVFLDIVEADVQLNCVDVHVLNESDERITQLLKNPRVSFFSAPEDFKDKAKIIPSIPSNIHYDAKLWQFLSQHAGPGDIWWNVAR